MYICMAGYSDHLAIDRSTVCSTCLPAVWCLGAFLCFQKSVHTMYPKLLGQARGRYTIRFILPEFVSDLGKRGVVCGKRLTFLYTSRYEHFEYNISGP